MSENWRPVVGWEDLYEVSDQGRVRSRDRIVPSRGGTRVAAGRVLRPGPTQSGRRTVSLSRDGHARPRRIYLLVLEAFVGPRPPGMCGCHNDGNPSNDALVNLRWDTWSGNQQDTIEHGRNAHLNTTHCPRGHELIPENLQRSMYAKTGKRACLACHRADSNYRSALKRGLPVDFQQLADRQFRRILANIGEQSHGSQ